MLEMGGGQGVEEGDLSVFVLRQRGTSLESPRKRRRGQAAVSRERECVYVCARARSRIGCGLVQVTSRRW